MTLVLQAGTAAFAAGQNSIFFPQSDLTSYGLDNASDTPNTATGYAKAIYALSKRIWAQFQAVTSPLGLSLTVPSPGSTIGDVNQNVLVSHKFAGSFSLVANINDGTIGELPIPTTGTNLGIGDVALTDLVPNAAKVASGANTAGAGLAIGFSSFSDLFSSLTYAGTTLGSGQDNRLLIAALFKSLALGLPVRATNVTSVYTAVSLGSLSGSVPPSTMYAATNPTTAINAADVASGSLIVLSQTFSWDIQTITDVDNVTTINMA